MTQERSMHSRKPATWWGLAWLMIALSGCTNEAAPHQGSSSSRIEGSFGGVSFQPQDAAFVYSSSNMSEALILLFTDLPDACAAIADGQIIPRSLETSLRAPDAHLLAWSVTGRLGSEGPDVIGPATIPAFFGEFGPAGQVNAYPMMSRTDAACESETVTAASGATGELVIDALTLDEGGRMAGRFEVRQAGEMLTGAFDVARCESSRPPELPDCP
jgi:hypothetical protein